VRAESRLVSTPVRPIYAAKYFLERVLFWR
jgi:hypothetical protein